MLKKIFLLQIGLVFFLSVNDLKALDINMDMIKGQEVVVHFEKPLRKVAREVIRLFPAVKEELENTFKTEINFTPDVMLIKDRNTFQMIVSNGPVVAVAMPGKDRIIIDNSSMKRHPFTLKITLKHELCHLFLHQIVGRGKLPKWLNEGLAQWASDGIAEVIVDENKDLLKQAILSEQLISLEDMETTFPADRLSLLLSYQESKSIAEYMISEFGFNRILRVLNSLRRGSEINEAIYEGVSISLYELETNWHEHLRRKITWFSYLSQHLYQILFILAALLLTYGFIRVLIRKWTYRDDEEEIE